VVSQEKQLLHRLAPQDSAQSRRSHLNIFQPRPSIKTPLLGNQQTLFRFMENLDAEW
jgi:hypothetical protein